MSGKKVPMKQKKALTWAIILWLSAPLTMAAAAADGSQSVTTKQVVVQSSQAEENAKWESQQVQIITAKEIEEKQAKSVEDVIFNQTGVSKTVDAMGRTGVSIRGAEPRHTLILIDGQPVMGDLAKYSGAMDEVMRLGTENVDHIEVIQGAASAKYGSDAIGGVINIITKKASATPQLQVNAESMRAKGDKGVAPYSNLFLRADSGQIGKLRLGVYGSKRDIMPVYASESRGERGSSKIRIWPILSPMPCAITGRPIRSAWSARMTSMKITASIGTSNGIRKTSFATSSTPTAIWSPNRFLSGGPTAIRIILAGRAGPAGPTGV